MLASIKKLIFAFILVFVGVLIWGLYYEYGIAAGITPAMGGGAMYIWWQFYKRKNPPKKESPDMTTSDKERIMKKFDTERIMKEFGISNIFNDHDKTKDQ
jgi:hypothetical protein